LSAIKTAPASSAMRRSSATKPGGGNTSPPRPWIGSNRIAPVARARRAPRRRRRRHEARLAGQARAERRAEVVAVGDVERAQAEPVVGASNATTPGRPVAIRAVFSADSTASEPDADRIAEPSPPGSTRASASSSSSLRSAGYTSPMACCSRPTCAETAASSSGGA
jgi:hypothetical protein